MEVAERYAAFASVDASGIMETQGPHPLIHGSRSQLLAEGIALIDPNHLNLEVPYRDDPLYWIEGQQMTVDGTRSIWVPVQCVFLF